ncbi:MAG: hypothetical protein AUH29_00640 [Candidatus Rokubacteria bacterium 13_1_40CM_69_27]|nr:MAG: hypothetical protein AUH29_00640 [Candidatus Rokubacteria bacterium 13_1_40CM_69_27]OLC35602.1 MAG: hypothetical protein AUH81_09880 [Candidatus Rokubacteria bacterium 13_1_40CM_4_69_5]
MKTRISIRVLLVLSFVLVMSAGRAAAQDATLYELTENMKLTRGKVVHRVATSALVGFAKVGTPLCPSATATAAKGKCWINAVGSDRVSETTGLGTFDGNFSVVVQGDNPVDGPELVVMKGRFSGQMDFAPALLHNLPYGTVEGSFVVEQSGRKIPFTGVFRLPMLGSFAVAVGVDPVSGVPVTRTLRELFCPLTPSPNPNLGGPDIAYVDTTDGAPNGKCIDVLPTELGLGWPTVRFDVTF